MAPTNDPTSVIMHAGHTNTGPEDMLQGRRSAHYKPNIWKYDFLQSLDNQNNSEHNLERAEMLVEDVEQMFVQATSDEAKLALVDTIKRLGLANMFETQIQEAIKVIASATKSGNYSFAKKEDLAITTLRFRLLRQYGYEISPDVFKEVLNNSTEVVDVKGLLELLEASHLALEGESTLDEIRAFSIARLKERVSNGKLSEYLYKQVVHALELSQHWRVEWFDVKSQVRMFENNKDHKNANNVLLELAKINFNVVQTSHQRDLREISRWWRDLGLIEQLEFTRDRLVESYLCALGLVQKPELHCFRECLTKVIVMILVVDDVYDLFGSLEELDCFTKAIDRWDSREIEELPMCMQLCFQALDDITRQNAYDLSKGKNWTQMVPHLRRAWAEFCKSLFKEAQWDNESYIPTLEEYLENAWISSSGPLILLHAFLSFLQDETTEAINLMERNKVLVYNSSIIIRLCNDLGTFAAERDRGDAPSSIVCYMREANVSEEIARKHVKSLIEQAWKKINHWYIYESSPSTRPLVDLSVNSARVAHMLYQHGDGFGVQDGDMRKQIFSSLVKPFSFN